MGCALGGEAWSGAEERATAKPHISACFTDQVRRGALERGTRVPSFAWDRPAQARRDSRFTSRALIRSRVASIAYGDGTCSVLRESVSQALGGRFWFLIRLAVKKYMKEKQLRQQLIQFACRMKLELNNRGKSGNLSVRFKQGLLITPSGLAYEKAKPADIVFIDEKGKAQGKRLPSSEWQLHHQIFRRYPDINAVLHSHSIFATTLACLEIDIPAFHYMIAVSGGASIRCAPYATFGTSELVKQALTVLEGRKACLLAHHGMLVLGRDLEEAFSRAIQVEALAEQYWRVLQIGKPNLLSEEEMKRVLEKFRGYGVQQ